jgi:hypothetical protein
VAGSLLLRTKKYVVEEVRDEKQTCSAKVCHELFLHIHQIAIAVKQPQQANRR